MVVAGNETTTKLLGNAWYWGWRFPDEGAKPLADPARVADWVEETLRYDNSTQMLLRVTRTDVEHRRRRAIPAGEKVLLLIGSANRDEEVFADPDRYDLERPASAAPRSSSASAAAGTSAWARPWPGWRPGWPWASWCERVGDYDIDPAGIVRVHSINVRGMASLPTTVKAR